MQYVQLYMRKYCRHHSRKFFFVQIGRNDIIENIMRLFEWEKNENPHNGIRYGQYNYPLHSEFHEFISITFE